MSTPAPRPPRLRDPQIVVGSFTLKPRPGGKIWIQHQDGEGMMTEAAKLEKHLLAFWRKEF